MKIYCDAHLHLSHSKPPVFEDGQYFCVSSCHSKEDLDFFKGASLTSFGSGVPPFANAHSYAPDGRFGTKGATYPCAFEQTSEEFPRRNHRFWRDSLKTCLASFAPLGCSLPCAFVSFGIHPQIVTSSYLKNSFAHDLSLLESLCAENKIVAIGECGFDFFTPEYKSTAVEQEIVFRSQLELAQKYNLPLVLHLRKSIEKIFSFSRSLAKLPSVIFHSFPGTFREAESLKNHGINAFFSFGKPILNGKKSAIDCVKNLPIQNLLLETDAPYQTLKNEIETFPSDIKKVYQTACKIRQISEDEICPKIQENFFHAFFLE